jgi:hypothetical protein
MDARSNVHRMRIGVAARRVGIVRVEKLMSPGNFRRGASGGNASFRVNADERAIA